MDKEQKIKNYLLFLAIVFSFLSVFGFFYLKDALFYFLLSAIFLFVAVLGLEIYLRIQHNIDKASDKQKIIEGQESILSELKKFNELNEENVDLLEILIDYLEEMSVKDARLENILKALESAVKENRGVDYE